MLLSETFKHFFIFIFFSANVLPVCMHVHVVCASSPQSSEDDIRSLEHRVKAGCELSCECKEPESGLLQVQEVL